MYALDKFYKTRDGKKARIFTTDNGRGVMLGAILTRECWEQQDWHREDGRCSCTSQHPHDLIGEWREPIKHVVRMWIEPKAPKASQLSFGDILGIGCWSPGRTDKCRTPVRITVEEIE